MSPVCPGWLPSGSAPGCTSNNERTSSLGMPHFAPLNEKLFPSATVKAVLSIIKTKRMRIKKNSFRFMSDHPGITKARGSRTVIVLSYFPKYLSGSPLQALPGFAASLPGQYSRPHSLHILRPLRIVQKVDPHEGQRARLNPAPPATRSAFSSFSSCFPGFSSMVLSVLSSMIIFS